MASQAVKRGVPEERLAGARRRGRELDEEARLRHSREEAAEALDAPGGGRGPRRAPRSSGGRDQTGRGVRGGSPARLAAPRIAGGGAEPVPRHQEGSCGPRGRRAQSSAPPLQIHALSKLCPGAGATALPAGGGPAALSSSSSSSAAGALAHHPERVGRRRHLRSGRRATDTETHFSASTGCWSAALAFHALAGEAREEEEEAQGAERVRGGSGEAPEDQQRPQVYRSMHRGVIEPQQRKTTWELLPGMPPRSGSPIFCFLFFV